MESNLLDKKPEFFSSIPNQTGSGMVEQSLYESYFGLKEKPFKLTPDPKFFYMSKEHQEAFAHLVFSIEENKGFATITGEVGTGKTTLCRNFLNHLDKKIKVAYIFNPYLTDVELLQNINDDLGIPSNNESKKYLIDRLNEYLLEEKRQGNKVILIIDEAQNLTPNVLEQLRLLSNLETETDKLIQIILVGQPELENTLSRPDLRQLKQRITIDWELLPLSKDETSSYIQHRTRIAGGNENLTFTRNAMGKIHEYSKGTPRLINVLADRALIVAFTLGKKQIDSKIVKFAINDLQKKNHEFAHKYKLTKKTILSSLLFLVFLFSVVFLYRSQKDSPPEIIKKEVVESDITIKTEPLAVETPVPGIDSQPQNSPALSEAPLPEEAPVLSTVSLPEEPPPLNKKEGFRNFLKQIADESKINAIAAVLDIWNLPPLAPDELARGKFFMLKKKRGLSYFKIDTDLQQLKLLNYPALLLFQPLKSQNPSFLLLAEVQNDQLTFISKGKKFQFSREAVEEIWTKKAYVFWKNFENFKQEMKKGHQGFEVIWLSKKLKELGFYDSKTTKVFDSKLKNAVMRFQKENKLKVDGVVGKETKIILYNKLGIYKTPQLKKVVG
ncbi:MAG TPA: AAA family ATPase [Nitrospinota bacterium]|nr:AAA family ATPase [Nitrospinota bacterium]